MTNGSGGSDTSGGIGKSLLRKTGPFVESEMDTRACQLKEQLDMLFWLGRIVEARFIGQPSGTVTQVWYRLDDAEKLAVELLERSDAMGPNCNSYIGRAPRARYGGRAYDIDDVPSHSFDVDARRDEPSGKTSSAAAIKDAAQVARLIAMKLDSPVRAMVATGNGYQLIIPFDDIYDIRGRRAWFSSAMQQWEEWVLKDIPTLTTTVDPQFDIPRVIKMVGSFSNKGGQHRPVYLEELVPDGEHVNVDAALDGADAQKKDDELSIQRGSIPPRFWVDLNADPRLRASWLGENPALSDKSGSGHDMSLVAQLRSKRYTPEECKAVLFACPAGKKRLTEKYIDLTIRKAYS